MIDGWTRKQVAARQLPRLAAALVAALALSACAQNGNDLFALGPLTDDAAQQPPPRDPAQAVAYYGKRYADAPKDKDIAIKYAQALTEVGHKSRALTVLRTAAVHHGNDPDFASVYGRTALANGQVKLASGLLATADDPSRPDWRIVSGRGTALAQQGKYKEAAAQFERALKLAPSNPSVLNNLAMAHAANGNLHSAERLLRKASLMPVTNPKVHQNLALVLRLQGREAEAARVQKAANAPLRSGIQPSPTKRAAGNQIAGR